MHSIDEGSLHTHKDYTCWRSKGCICNTRLDAAQTARGVQTAAGRFERLPLMDWTRMHITDALNRLGQLAYAQGLYMPEEQGICAVFI
jgi:hypothetical protein